MHEITQQVVETSRPMNRTRVMIVDDHALFREGMASLFAYEDDFEVAGQAADGVAAASPGCCCVPRS